MRIAWLLLVSSVVLSLSLQTQAEQPGSRVQGGCAAPVAADRKSETGRAVLSGAQCLQTPERTRTGGAVVTPRMTSTSDWSPTTQRPEN